jgi:outer membrane protein TolC
MDIVYNVTAKFYQVYSLAYEHQINQGSLTNAQEALRITKLKQEAGNLPESEMLTAEINAAQSEVRAMESEGKLNTAKDEFKLLIGLDLNKEIELDADMEFKSFLIDMQKAIHEALANRMEIQEEKIGIDLQAIEIKRAKRERELKGYVSAYYDFTGISPNEKGSVNRLIESSFQNMMDRPPNRGIGLKLEYPIADWGRAKNQVKREQIRMKQRELNLENTKRSIENEIREIVRSALEAEKRYRMNQLNQDAMRKSYKISQLRFENGDMTNSELFIEQGRLSQVQLDYISSYITYRLSVANLSRKTMYDFENNRSYLLN